MQKNKAFIILESVEPLSREQGCVYIENTVLGMVLIINLFNFKQGANYKLVLTDADGHTSINSFSENYTMIKVLDGFDLCGSIYAEVFNDGDIALKGFYNFAEPQIKNFETTNLIKNKNLVDNQTQSFGKNSKPHLSAMEWAIENSEKDIYDEAVSFVNRLNLGLIKPQINNILENPDKSIVKDADEVCNFEKVSTFSPNTENSNFNELKDETCYVDNSLKLSKTTAQSKSYTPNESYTLKDLIVNGSARVLGTLHATKFKGTLEGNANTATTASKLGTNAGSGTQPVYFSNGVPTNTTYTLGKSVPSDAKFTDTTYSAATTSENGLMSSTDKKKLDGIATGANKTIVDSALSSTSTNPVQNKVVNTAIGNLTSLVGNTAVATQISTAIASKADLDTSGKVPSSQLPSYVDDVIEYNGKSNFPSTGESGKIYVDTATNLTYRWSGSVYVEISPSLALGETSSTAYRGDRGKTAYDHSQSTHARTDATKTAKSSTNGNILINGTETTVYTHPGSGTNPHGTTKSDVGLGNVGNFKAVSTVASQGLTDTEKSNARANIGAGTSSFSGNYNDLTNKPTIPTVGNGTVTIKQAGTSKGTFTMNQSGNTTIELTDNNTDTKVTAVGNHYTPSGGTTTSASGGTLTDITNSSSGVQVVTGVTKDAAGHVTGVTSAALKSVNTVYTHPSAHAATMITEDATHRFVTDTEKTTWNNKASKSTITTTTLLASN